jgi:hypothetical protein
MSISTIGTFSSPAATGTTTNSGLVFNGGLATYAGKPVALSDIYDDKTGKYTEAQQVQASETQNVSEQAAFGKYAGSGTQAGNKQYFEAYVSYVQNLPIYEQNSQRYSGTLQAAKNFLSEIDKAPSPSTGTSESDDANESGVRKILKSGPAAQDKNNKSTALGKGPHLAPVDFVDLSPAAHTYLSTVKSSTSSAGDSTE